MVGSKILAVKRRGKFLWLELNRDFALAGHLGMSGQFKIKKKKAPIEKHVRVRLDLGKIELHFIDQRTFGYLSVEEVFDGIPENALHIAKDPFDPAFDAKGVIEKFLSKKTEIKRALLDQEIMSGVGNIYANEALFLAGISPFRKAQDLSLRDCQCLVEAIQTVLGSAIEMGGTTLRDFVNASGQPGYFSQTLNVYGREGKPCPNCGIGVASMRQNQRSSYWCPVCQI